VPALSEAAASGREHLAHARSGPRARRLPGWWPLAALMILAAALRFSTLTQQSFWYDEAFTPVHVLHASLAATLRAVVHTENTPPLWYVIAWADARVFGTGELALRLPSALAGVATVPVAWAIGRELTGRRTTAIAAAALVACNPLFVWYSQEARAYELSVLTVALAMLCLLRARRAAAAGEPSGRWLAAFAVSGSLALLTHYFTAFLLLGMVGLLLWDLVRERAGQAGLPGSAGRWHRRATLSAVGFVAAVGIALVPLAVAQGGHNAQWIGRWALGSRLATIPQYYLTGYSGAPLGHGIELLVALPIIVGIVFGLWRVLLPREERGAMVALVIAAAGILIPFALVGFGADYLGPRNLVAAMIPITALIAVVVPSQRAGRVGIALTALIALAFLAICIDVDLSPRLQRGNWRGLARAIGGARSGRVITTVQLGSAPLEYYLAPLRPLRGGASVTVREIDETGYSPLRPGAARPPAPGFRLRERRNVDGLLLYRFVSPVPWTVSEATLRGHVITLARQEVLVPARSPVLGGPARAGAGSAQPAPSAKTT